MVRGSTLAMMKCGFMSYLMRDSRLNEASRSTTTSPLPLSVRRFADAAIRYAMSGARRYLYSRITEGPAGNIYDEISAWRFAASTMVAAVGGFDGVVLRRGCFASLPARRTIF